LERKGAYQGCESRPEAVVSKGTTANAEAKSRTFNEIIAHQFEL